MPTLRLDADARKGVKAFQDLDKAIDKTEKSLEVTSREAKKLETAAGRIVKQNEAPLERYNRKVAETAKLVKQGALSYDQAHAAVSRYRQQLEKAEQRSQGVWGHSALSSIGALVTGYFSVASAVGAVSRALQTVEQNSQQAADSFYNGLGAIGELQQVSGSPEEFKKNLGFARSLVRRGIFEDIGSASDFTFAATSAGYTDEEKEYLAKIGESKQIRPDNLTGFAASARKVQNLFKGESLQAAGDKLLVASGFTQANITQTAEAVPLLTSTAQALGYDPNDVLAQLVAGEEAAPNIDIAKTEQAAFLTAVLNKDLNAGSLTQTVDALRQRELAGENISQLLGNVRAFRGYSALVSQRGEFDAALAAIKGSGGALESRKFLDSDDRVASAATRELADARLKEFIGEKYGEKEDIQAAIVADLNRSYGAGVSGTLNSWALGYYDITGQEEYVMRSTLGNPEQRERLSPETISRVESYLERIANASEGGGTRQEN